MFALLQGLMNGDGVTGFVVPTPQLHIFCDGEPRSTASATRSYVRDAKRYLQLVKGGDRDKVKCLFVGATLGGVAKEWYDHWTTVQEHFMFDELTNALLTCFAPGNQSQIAAMYRELHAGTYRMQPNESVEAYQLHLEDLIAPMVSFSERDYIYWFQQGLPLMLARASTTDLTLAGTRSYERWVQIVRNIEARIRVGQEPPTSLAPLSATTTQNIPNKTDPAPETTGILLSPAPMHLVGACRDSHAPSPGPQELTPRGSLITQNRRKRKDVLQATAESRGAESELKWSHMQNRWLTKWGCTQAEFVQWRQLGVCLRCAADHPTRSCLLLPPLAIGQRSTDEVPDTTSVKIAEATDQH
ncbi:hypothetical protein VaNZ11_008959 [Volvox africanus]|uniref:Retrotransposon gag domain-containing protein n=1 Tax=Volvox africanus TaxID=51714 RepID=A0ABQ5S671_9CHLO|nr:hypothetical protein VaNZ11_008959 [Volvox africanus]